MIKKLLAIFAMGALLGCPQPSAESDSGGSGGDSDGGTLITPSGYYITDLEATAGENLVNLSWSVPEDATYMDDGVEKTYYDDFYTTITFDDGNGDSGSELFSGGEANIRNLSNDVEYTFTLVARSEDFAGIVTETSSITATPVDDGIDPVEETINVSSLSALNDAIGDLTEGQTIILADGIYSGDIDSISGKYGSEGFPITIKAASNGGVTIDLDGTITFKNSSHIVFQGFNLTSDAYSMMKVINSDSISILDNVFDEEFGTSQTSAKTVVISSSSGISSDLVFGYNVFKNKNNQGGFITVEYDETFGISTDITINNNYFLNMMPEIDVTTGEYAGDSDREAICFGDSDSADIDTNYIVEYNLFEDCDGENEIITNKTSSNIYRYNTFKNSYGCLSLRYGDDHQVYGNFFIGDSSSSNSWEDGLSGGNVETGGIRLYGVNQKIYNNYFYGLTGESSTHRMPIVIDGGGSGGHYKVEDSIIAFNTIVDCHYGIGLGMNYSSAPTNNYIGNNLISNTTANSILEDSGDSSNIWEGNIAYSTVTDTSPAAYIASTANPNLALADGIYKLSATSTNAIDSAVDSDSVYGDILTDIDGGTRSVKDIGADEYGVTGGNTVLDSSSTNIGPRT